ncbi:hypothetical protein DNFV4_01303 [Nitrospira tepida]|uniref:DUF2905 domain-containing protein n=1 Tax=Nitrospira tepida TaxID=2973512 RepID=A0AA86MXP8_9BACT|nr:DUF2905 domain-containing protein [Nitrospira tepida]CAI4030871.1 hypothetical protein DNFV4_01303 [Nitrospira tepida]
MDGFGWLGRVLILGGILLVALGGLLVLAGKLPGLGDSGGWFGRLPGDLYIKRDNFTFYAPLTTGLIVSVVLSLLWFILSILFKR